MRRGFAAAEMCWDSNCWLALAVASIWMRCRPPVRAEGGVRTPACEEASPSAHTQHQALPVAVGQLLHHCQVRSRSLAVQQQSVTVSAATISAGTDVLCFMYCCLKIRL